MWALCGAFSANKLQDGYVGPEDLKHLGCTDAIRAALKGTLGPDGEPDPLWVDGRDGGVNFTKWVKYQRCRAEVKAYRDADAERKRNERKAGKGTTTSGDAEMSGRTSAGHPPDHRDPKTETETKRKVTNLCDDSHPSNATHAAAAEPTHIETAAKPAKPHASSAAKTVVRQELGKHDYPANTIERLAVQAETLYHEGKPDALIREAIREWDRREDARLPEFLISVYGDCVKRARAQPGNNGRPPSKLRTVAELAQAERAKEQAALAQHQTPQLT
ncbi:hypothetical protein [Mycobacterium kansasii]|uniref:hypothetical protein n=1 Tax=Mycobacterium kansasii TaxID=1768 RepID=UPI0015E36A38|nr:hypothetical protein [Mycobacterium kansasii]